MKIPTLSLAMITNTSNHLEQTIGSVARYVDEIVVVDNGKDKKVKAICNKFNARYLQVNPKENPEFYCEYPVGVFNPNFTRLRRLSFEACTKDWILWLDNDDIFINPDQLRDTLIKADKYALNMINLQYKYEIDKDGNIIQQHNKERIIRRGTWNWEFDSEWAVHENMYPGKIESIESTLTPIKNGERGDMVFNMVVEHHKELKEKVKSNTRNYNILMWMLKKEKFQKDPRAWFLLARELISLAKYEEAIQVFNKYLNMEYAAHDALLACIRCAEISEAMADFNGALNYAMRGIGIRPDHPIGYLYAARFLNYQGKPKEAIAFLKQAEEKPINPMDSYTQEPLSMAWLTLKGYVDAYKRLKDYKEIITLTKQNKSRFTGEWRTQIDEMEKEAIKNQQMDKMIESVKMLIDNRTGELMSENKTPTIKDYDQIFALFDKSFKLSPLYMELRRKLEDFRVHDDNEITIVHINNFEAWDPETLYKNGGGGSETACIELSTVWAKLGYKVTVYAEPPVDNTVFNGVTWRKFETINFSDRFNIFISLRGPSLFTDYQIEANKKFLWLQDIMIPEMYTPDLVDQLDKIIVLSKYHRETGYNVPESKFYYTTNGINLRLVEEIEAENIKRIKNKCVYISSADRGLQPLVKMWPEIKKQVKDADLSWAYGWNSWNAIRNKEGNKFKNTLIKDMKNAGVHELGRISKRDLYRLLLSASYHTYPLVGPAETSCIAVMESQALGAFPITTGITALEETQQFGIKVPLKHYIEATIKTMNAELTDTEEERQKMMKWARETYDWNKVGANWVKDLFQ